MSSGEDVFAAIVGTAAICIACSVGWDDTQYPQEHYAAEKLCVANQGYKKINYDWFTRAEVVCNDGALFKSDFSQMITLGEEK